MARPKKVKPPVESHITFEETFVPNMLSVQEPVKQLTLEKLQEKYPFLIDHSYIEAQGDKVHFQVIDGSQQPDIVIYGEDAKNILIEIGKKMHVWKRDETGRLELINELEK